MSNKTKGILLAAILVAALVGGAFAYKKLSASYKANAAGDVTGSASASSEADGASAISEADSTSKSASAGSEADSTSKSASAGSEADGTSEGAGADAQSVSAGSAADESGEESAAESSSSEELPFAWEFEMKNSDGETVKLSDFVGKPIVINFWASWCPPCKGELPAFDEVYQEYQQRVNFIMLNLTDGVKETEESARAFYDESGYTFPIYFDDQLQGAYAYGAYSIPLTVIITAEGRIKEQHAGMLDKQSLISLFSEELDA